MNKLNIIFGIGGFVAGLAAGFFGSRAYWKCKYETLYEENKEILEERYCYSEPTDGNFKVIVQNDEELDEEKLTDEQRAEIKRKLKENHNRTTNYAEIYKSKRLQEAEDAESRDDQNDEPEWTDKSIQQYHDDHKDDAPEVISRDDMDNLPPSVEIQELILYYYDDTIVDPDAEEEIEDIEALFGGCLSEFYQNEQDEIIVLNNALDSCYVVKKVMNSWYNPDPDIEN